MLIAKVGLALAAGCGECLLNAGTNRIYPFPAPVLRPAAAPGSIQLPRLARPATFNLNEPSDLHRLIQAASNAIARSTAPEARQKAVEQTSLAEMTLAELKAHFGESREDVSKHERHGCEELIRLAQAALASSRKVPDDQSRTALAEVARAMRNDRRSPTPNFVASYTLPFVLLDYLSNPIGKGESPAANVTGPREGELDRHDPPASSFWTPTTPLASQDLYHGFGCAALPELEEPLWTYAGPKTSYGRWPGFEAVSGQTRIKVKFGETKSEPFTARIFSALGYNIEPTDHAARLKLRYDRRFFREFHLRKEIRTEVRAAGLVRVWTVDLQPRFDPFDCIIEAVLKDGSRIPGPELKGLLLPDGLGPHPEDWPANFHREFEARIDYLLTAPANVQVKDKTMANIGPWEFERLGHEDLRELRGAGLLAAWLGWSDSRFENTRLKVVRTPFGPELKHFFTDLGGSLGKATGPLSCVCESPNSFPWTFTRAPKVQGKGRMTAPFRIVDFQPIDDTLAFEKMTVDDARWMARKIGQLREEQIVQALVASGFDSAEVKLYKEKLVSRRDRMIQDLGLASEVPLLRPQGVQRDLTYDPQHEGPVFSVLSNGKVVFARIGEHQIEGGRLITASLPDGRSRHWGTEHAWNSSGP
jgi:hypothetical protein